MAIMNIGCFSIPRIIIDSHPEVAKEILKDLIIVRAEMMFWSNSIEYTALNDQFETEEGYMPTCYHAIIRKDLIETEGEGCSSVPVFEGFSKL